MGKDDGYYHAIRLRGYGSLPVLESILKQGIISIRSGAYKSSDFRMNDEDEICLSKPDNSIKNLFFGNSAFEQAVSMAQIILVIDGGIEGVTKPRVLDRITATYLAEKGKTGYTEFTDEYRTKIPIDKTKIRGILFPGYKLLTASRLFAYNFKDNIRDDSTFDERKKVVENYYTSVSNLVNKSGIDIPIYDLDTGLELKTKDDLGKKK